MAMSKTAVDVVADSNHQVLHRIMQLVDTPEYVKTAGVINAEQVKQLPQLAFADPVNRKFPLHTKAATWLAQAYFGESRHLYSSDNIALVQEKITKAAAYWGIAEHVKAAALTLQHTRSTAPGKHSDADYAMVVKIEGKPQRLLPIHSAENVKAAAATLYNGRMKFPYAWRKLAARKILHKAAEFGVTDIDSDAQLFLDKAASFGSAVPTRAAEKLAHRALMLGAKHQDEKIAMSKLAKTVNGMKDIPAPHVMEKLAAIVDQFDRAHNFYQYYDQGVETPEEIFFDLTQKKAADIRDGYVQLTTGSVVPFTALLNVKLDKVAAIIGDDFAKAVAADDSLGVDPVKFARVARTLPRDDAVLLERALAASGVKTTHDSLVDIVVPA